MQNTEKDRWVALFAAVTWGFTMWSRTSFAYYAPELGISASELGAVNFVTSVGSMLGAVVLCRIADRKGWHTQVLTFGLCLAAGMQALISASSFLWAIVGERFVLGFGLGCVYSLVQAIVKQKSRPERYSANVGIVENGEAVISTMLGPVLIVQMISLAGWRGASRILMLPVLVLALGWMIFGRRSGASESVEKTEDTNEKVTFRELLGIHNIRLCIPLVILTLTNIWTMYTYCPMYWTTVAGFSDVRMSRLMTLTGTVAIVWCFSLPVLSDRFGRKKVTAVFAALCAAAYLFLAVLPGSMVSICFFVAFAGSACTLSLFFMTLIVTESVKPEYAASGISLVNACGEILGGAVGPLMAGWLADRFSAKASMLYGGGCMAVILVLICFLQETASIKKNLPHENIV